jgi:hypothetical protein
VLDHRPAVEICERLSGETCRLIAGGDDGDDGEARLRVTSVVAADRVHGES